MLIDDGFYFWDGHDFKDAGFRKESIIRGANFHNNIKLKIINELQHTDEIINSLNSTTREIYQFYLSQPYYTNLNHAHIKIQINETKNIDLII
jgi:hypothetical protein